jgi:predicted transcriptional regulator
MNPMIGLRVSPEFKALLQKLADEENRTVSNFVENAIMTYIKEHKGINPKKRSSSRKEWN